jgi:hypothetical protein
VLWISKARPTTVPSSLKGLYRFPWWIQRTRYLPSPRNGSLIMLQQALNVEKKLRRIQGWLNQAAIEPVSVVYVWDCETTPVVATHSR